MDDKKYLITNGIVSLTLFLILAIVGYFAIEIIIIFKTDPQWNTFNNSLFTLMQAWIDPAGNPEWANGFLMVVGLVFDQFAGFILIIMAMLLLISYAILCKKNINFNLIILIVAIIISILFFGNIAQMSQIYYKNFLNPRGSVYTKFSLMLIAIILSWGLFITNKFVFKT